MTAQDVDPARLTPEDMDWLRARLEQRHGMTPAEAAEEAERVAAHLAATMAEMDLGPAT